MNINIDGKVISVKEEDSILEAALEAGVFIPHLCNHPDLEAQGGCHLCSVEVEGIEEAVLACSTKVTDGMNVRIYGDKANHIRNTSMELILASHPAECTGCPKYGKCELQSMFQFLGASPERWRKKSRTLPNDNENPLIHHLFTRCVRCGRCIRACRDLRGVKVLDYIEDKAGVHAGVPEGKSLAEAGCRFCGACIEVCPTGSIIDALMIEDQTYEDAVVPCKAACPAHIDIPQFIRNIKLGRYGEAAAVIREKVPFPAVLGSICTHQCESDCKRNYLNEAVSVCKLKYKVAEQDEGLWKSKRVLKPKTKKRVAVVGAGPAGLTAAYYLAKQGHSVEIFEENEKAGGQCRYGIPAYRLPDEILDKEIQDILEVGMVLHTSSPQYDADALLADGFDAVAMTIGTHQGNTLPLEGADLEGVLINTDFLKAAREGMLPRIGENVVVLGGGNVAYDCGRTAIRLGAKNVHLVCLESREAMTSTEDEIEEGKEEGIILHTASSFKKIVGSDCVQGLEIQRIDRFYFDDQKKLVVDLIPNSEEILPADNVIFAVGQRPKKTECMGLELVHGPYIKVNETLETNKRGVFAAGDVVTGTKSVITAIEGGRKLAENIDRFLGGDGDISETLSQREKNPFIGECKNFSNLSRMNPEVLPAAERIQKMEPYEGAFTEEDATYEASRCLQCDLRLDLTRPKLWTEY